MPDELILQNPASFQDYCDSFKRPEAPDLSEEKPP